MSGRDQAEGLRELASAVGVAPVADELIMYRRMWLDLKGELEAESEGKRVREYVHIGQGAEPSFAKDLGYQRDEHAQAMLDRMLQMETMARFVRVPPATPETFESVRKDMAREGA